MAIVSPEEKYAAIEMFDLEAWAQSRGGVYSGQTGDEMVLVCPRCAKPKLCVNVHKRAWHCWYCQRAAGEGSGMLELLSLVDRRHKVEVVDYIVALARRRPMGTLPGWRTSRPQPSVRRAPRIDWPRAWARIDSPADYAAWPYIAQRGITLAEVHYYGLVVCTAGRYIDRLMFPVFERGCLVYYQGRAMYEADNLPPGVERFTKSLNPKREHAGGTSHDQVLFGLDHARVHPRVALCEGPIDAIRAGPSAVATFGKALSYAQIQKLRQAGVRALDLMWDGPSPTEPQGARPQMARIAPVLADLFDVRVVHLPHGDPGSMARRDLDALRAAAPRAIPA